MALKLQWQPPGNCWILRISQRDIAAVETGAKLCLPMRPGSAGAASWIGPGSWLWEGEPPELPGSVAAHLADVTDQLVRLRVSGTSAADFLLQGMSLDLHAGEPPIGVVTRTLFAGMPVLFRRRNDEYEILLDQSLRSWLAAWLETALGDFAD